ncbi:MAG: hydroxymethylpyrimidine/phosphomethylpyrimidine kinase [Sphingobacteriales bacterium]|jgi:hydroxymethylpyrimidine/phosphomethylpyrimidine kinase|nr:MAG: hydroxymethylpyrimidine/phosphomethylpyrimidine kinase [Sphingobacteriales bacterium]
MVQNKKTNARPIVLSIAGFDPSAGAGILSDIKTMEEIGVYGMGIVSSITYQTDNKFLGVHWLSAKEIIHQLKPILKQYTIKFIKIGLIKDLETLNIVLKYIKKYDKSIFVIVDPILRASAGFKVHNNINNSLLKKCLKKTDMLIPNWNEVCKLSQNKDAIKAAEKFAKKTIVFLKGGHSIETPATDILFYNGKIEILHPEVITELEKHGTGCVISSAIVANLALGYELLEACTLAKSYTLKFLTSNQSNLGYHHTKQND